MSTKTIRPGLAAATEAGPALTDPAPNPATTATPPPVAAPVAVDAPTDVLVAAVPPNTSAGVVQAADGQWLPDEPATWWFTFPPGHRFAGRYAATFGTYESARAGVVARFGHTFAGQFASAEEAGIAQSGLVRLRADQWPPAVEETTPAPDVLADTCSPCPEPAACADRGVCQRADAGGGPVEHRHVAGSGGGPGECSATCACGATFDGFDSIAEAVAVLDAHIADPDGGDVNQPQPGADAPVESDGPQPLRVRAAALQRGMFVATEDPDVPGWEVRHVEPSDDDGRTFVGVVLAGPQYLEYDVNELVDLVDQKTVAAAAGRARARAHRAQQIHGLRRLADLAETDDFFPLPQFTLHLRAGLDSPEAVRRFAAALEVPVTEDGYGLRTRWTCGGIEYSPALLVEVDAPHPGHTRPAGVR